MFFQGQPANRAGGQPLFKQVKS